MDLSELPESARSLARHIQSVVDEARELLGPDVPAELVYTLNETPRYLRDAIAAFLAVPHSRRATTDANGNSPESLLLAQLSVIDRSIDARLDELSRDRTSQLRAHGRFLAERFGDSGEAVAEVKPRPARAADVFADWFRPDASATDIVSVVAERMQRAFPSLTELRRGGFFGLGAIEAASLTIPFERGSAFRWQLAVVNGTLQATVAKLVHGTPVQTISCGSREWLDSLYEDLEAYAARNAQMSAPFKALFSR